MIKILLNKFLILRVVVESKLLYFVCQVYIFDKCTHLVLTNIPSNHTHSGDPEQFWNCAEVSVLPVSTENPDPGSHAADESICGSGVTPTPPVEPTPMTPPTSPSPPTSPVDPNTEGYCNWGPLGTGLSSTCDGCVQGGNVCNAGAHQCESGEYLLVLKQSSVSLYLTIISPCCVLVHSFLFISLARLWR